MRDWLRMIVVPPVERCCRKERLDREFDEELTTHLELLVDEGRRRGMSPADARREAHPETRPAGVPPRIAPRAARHAAAGRARTGPPVRRTHAVEESRRSPASSTLSLALGIGANTALFSLVDDLLLRSLPVTRPERLVQVRQTVRGLGFKKVGASFPREAFDYIRAHNQVLSERGRFQSAGSPRR